MVLLFEADEESGSGHIHHYIEKLKAKIGDVSVVFCLDSMCGNYEQLWQTTTLRGVVMGVLKVTVLNEGVHSGEASGIVPSSFRIVRQLLDRLENSKTGEVVQDFQVVVPGSAYASSEKSALALGKEVFTKFPFHNNTQPVSTDPFTAYMNGIWKAQLALVGASGLPDANVAGNVLRPSTTVKISIRIPPTKDPKEAEEALKRIVIKYSMVSLAYNRRAIRSQC